MCGVYVCGVYVCGVCGVYVCVFEVQLLIVGGYRLVLSLHEPRAFMIP